LIAYDEAVVVRVFGGKPGGDGETTPRRFNPARAARA
jgi:hypothetical protein